MYYPSLLPDDYVVPPVRESRMLMCGYFANLVLTSTLSTTLDLIDFVCATPVLSYTPERFAASFLRFETPRSTCLIFPSGKVVVTGAHDIYTAYYDMVMICDMIINKYPLAKVGEVKIQNLTANVNLGFFLDIKRCQEEHASRCVYHPGDFPGMHIKEVLDTVSHGVFQSGRIVITGARTSAQAMKSIRIMYPMYAAYRLEHGTAAAKRVCLETQMDRNRGVNVPSMEEALDLGQDDEDVESLIKRYG